MKLQKHQITDNMIEEIDNLFNTINDLERIGDHCENISELGNEVIELNIKFNKEIENNIKIMFEQVLKNCEDAIELIENRDDNKSGDIIIRENKVNNIEQTIKKEYISKLNNNQNEIDMGLVSLEIIGNLERISDHCSNIARRYIK